MPLSLIGDPAALDLLQGEHRLSLVLASWLIACSAAYVGLDIARLVQDKALRLRHGWLLAGAVVMGLGVWSMHFVGMHAYRLPFPVAHAPGLTLLSIVPAMLGSLVALAVVAGVRERHHVALPLAGILLGLGIGTMHYTGMAAMRMPAELHYDVRFFLLSLLVAMGLGIVGVYAYRACLKRRGGEGARAWTLIAALWVSLAISGMHYVAMQAAWFAPLPGPTLAAMSRLDDSDWLAYLIGASAVLIALLMLAGIWIQRRLRDSEQRQRITRTRLLEVISALQDGVVLFDERTRILLCNAAFERLLGLPRETLEGSSLRRLAYAEEAERLNATIRSELAHGDRWSGTIRARHANGQGFPARVNISRVRYTESDDCDYVAMLTDISAEEEAQRRIHYLAYHDALTGLPNRRSLQERLMAMAAEARQGAPHAALILLDVDKFKSLNDSLGQATGDELLRQLALRLAAFARERAAFAARLDGNEFALLLPVMAAGEATAAESEGAALAAALQTRLQGHYSLQGYAYPCRLSVGLLVWPLEEAIGHDEWLKRAGLALLEAKRRRDGEPRLFEREMEVQLEARLAMEGELRRAIEEDQLCLYLQPQVEDGGRIVGAEGLVRWQHPRRGLVSPGQFIPLAEESGLILPLGQWVLEAGCRLLGQWQADPAYAALKLSLNVSVRQFQQPDFVARVQEAMRRHAVPPGRLLLELTESLLVSDADDAIEKMTRLKRAGVAFALDDFGTGYSSLAYLQSLPLDALKIDVAFVRDLGDRTQTRPIAATIIALAESLGLQVVAEGVETARQQETLRQLGCRVYQGYRFGRPCPVAAFRPHDLSSIGLRTHPNQRPTPRARG